MDSIPIFLNLVQQTIDQRGRDYGTPAENLKRISTLWSMHLEFEITEYDVAIMMCQLKIARLSKGHHQDSLEDAAAYLSIANSLKAQSHCTGPSHPTRE